MAVGRLVLAGLAAAGAYGAWRARQRPGSAAGRQDGATGGAGSPATRAVSSAGSAPSAAAGAAESGTTLPDRSGPLPSDPTGGLDGGRRGDVAGLHSEGTRGEDPLTGVTESPSDLPEATASPDGTPAAGRVETRRVGDEPA